MHRLQNKYTGIALLIILGVIIGWYGRIYYISFQPTSIVREIRAYPNNYSYINPLLLVDISRRSPDLANVINPISTYIDSTKQAGNASDISVYFRDLNTARWSGIDEDHTYEPSSMLKVLVMLAYLKDAEVQPDILTQALYYNHKDDTGQYYKPLDTIASGYYTVQDLIKLMIVDSDNDAAFALNEHNKQGFARIYQELELPPQPTTSLTDFMSPRSYSAVFRVLFNASDLTNATSENALKLLTLTNFNKGLAAGVPKNIVVAHKFGEHTDKYTDGNIQSRQLHDCGIIYYPKHPYLLCVMTKGTDFSKLEDVISQISKIAYERVSAGL